MASALHDIFGGRCLIAAGIIAAVVVVPALFVLAALLGSGDPNSPDAPGGVCAGAASN
jgi:hypothetical protein